MSVPTSSVEVGKGTPVTALPARVAKLCSIGASKNIPCLAKLTITEPRLPLSRSTSIMAPKRNRAGNELNPDCPRDKSGNELYADWWSVNVLGVQSGGEIRGIRRSDTGIRTTTTDLTWRSVEGVVLKVVDGAILPYEKDREYARKVWDSPGGAGWANKLASKFGVAPPQAQLLIDQFETYSEPKEREGLLGWQQSCPFKGNPQQVPGQSVVKVRILETGAWSHSEKMLQWQADGIILTTGQIGVELDRAQKADPAGNRPGYLALRPYLWVQAPSSGRVNPKITDEIYINASAVLCGPDHAEEHYDVEMADGSFKRVVMPPSGPVLNTQDVSDVVFTEVIHLMSDACKYKVKDEHGQTLTVSMFGNLNVETARDQVAAAFGVLSGSNVRFGALKSCLQKMARIQANQVRIPLPPEGYPQITLIDGRILVMVALAITFTSRGGGFVPDLGLYVKGQVAAMKRLGVTMVEDAWPERPMLKGLPGKSSAERDPGIILAALMGASLVCMRVVDYNVPLTVIKSCLHIMAASLHSSNVIAWRSGLRGTEMSGRANAHYMGRAAVMLRTLVSFHGDMDMFDEVATMATEDGKIMIKGNPNDIGGVVPLMHLIDQHVYRGVAHVMLAFPTLEDETFSNRFRLTFSCVTGFNPRLAGGLINESDPIVVAVRYAESIVQLNIFPSMLGTRWDQLLPEHTMEVEQEVTLDYGVMSAGVGTLGPFKVSTTVEENTTDGYYPGGKPSDSKWNLLVILPVEKPGEIVINYVSAHHNDNSKKAAPTPSAKKKAIAAARAKGTYKFSSPMMPGFNNVEHVRGGQYRVTGPTVQDVMWRFDHPNTITTKFFSVNAPEKMDLKNDDHVLRWARERTPPTLNVGMASNWSDALKDVFTTMPAGINAQQVLLRMLSFIKQQYTDVTLPTPDLKGQLGSDQMKAQQGDWLVWRMLLATSRLCPGALVPKQVPSFIVPDARLLRLVEKQLVELVKEAAAVPEANSKWVGLALAMQTHWEQPGNKEPFDYQTALVNTMLNRDREAIIKTQGHFVSLETGMGKSFVGLNYSVRYAAEMHGVDKILWVTPKKVIETFEEEARKSWDVSVGVADRSSPEFRRNSITIVGFEWFSNGSKRGTLEAEFLKAAKGAFIVFDEVHNMYTAAIRNSTMREAALLCTKFCCMTATPIGSPSQAYAIDWLKDTVGFPVSRDNQLVASAMMVAARVELPIESKEVLKEVTLPSQLLQQHTQLLQTQGNWGLAAKLCRDASMPILVQTAIDAAIADRTTNPGGGCLLVLDNQEELNTALALIASNPLGIRATERTTETQRDASIGVILVTKSDVTGYNLTRMGAIVTCVYASNAAKRHQLRGRIRRLGQTRDTVKYFTVVPKHTILELLHQRHNSIDKTNESLAQLAEEFVRENTV